MRTKRTDHRKSSASRARRGAPASGRAAPLRALVTDADWRRLVQLTFDGALIHDGRKVLDANASFARMFGYPLNRLRGLGVFDLLTEEGAATVRRHMRGRVERRFETTCRRADGTPFPVEVAARNLRHNGRFLRLVAVRDLSERIEALHTAIAAELRLQRSLVSAIEMLARTIEKRDPYTAGHQNRVAALAVAIARELDLDPDHARGIEMAALVHDVGKIYVPGEILTRPGRFTPEEYNLVKTHCAIGHDIVKEVDLPWPIADVVLQHHERLDGSGYPQSLKGDAILFAAQIIAVADVVEAITAHRPYRPALGLAIGLDEIKKNRGRHFRSEIVDACLAVFKKTSDAWPGASVWRDRERRAFTG